MILRRLLATALGCWGLSLALPAGAADGPTRDEGLPFTQHFSPLDYHANTQCWSIVQDARGIVYVANYALVLEYDGSAWRKIPMGKPGWVNRLAYDAATDTIFVGGQNDLGYLRPARDGGRSFVSLLDQLPADARNVGEVRGVHVTPEGVFFVGANWVRRWRDGRLQGPWNYPGVGRLHSDWAGGRFYLQHSKIGLLCWQGDGFAPASDDPLFRRAAVWSLVDGPGGEVTFGTHQDGLFALRDGRPVPWEGEINAYLKQKGVYRLLRLRDGSLAIATATAGLVLLDAQGHFRSHVDGVGGLHGNDLYDLCEDAEGGLWIGLQSGVTRAEIASPYSLLSAGVGDDLSGIYSGGRWLDSMILCTSNGLYRLAGADPATATGAHLERVPGVSGAFSSAVPVEEGIILAGDGKVVLFDRAGQIVPLLTTHSNEEHLRRSRTNPDRVFVAEEQGRVSALDRDPATRRWAAAGVVVETGRSGANYGVVESSRGDLWLGTNEHGLLRARPAAGGAPAAVTALRDEPGPLRGENSVWIDTSGGPMICQTPKSFYRLDESEENVRLATEYGPWFTDGTYHPESVVSYEEGSLWVTASPTDVLAGDPLYGRVTAAGDGRPAVFQALPRKIEQVIGHFQGFFPLDVAPAKMTALLVAGSTGNSVVRVDLARWEAQLGAPRPFATLIRRAETTDDGRNEPVSQDALPHARNSVRFEFSAGTFAYGAIPQFQTRLAGFGQGRWSDWNERPNVDYLNLPEGRYTFEVRARTADGRTGGVASHVFRVLPPWQRTPWAYASYALALVLGVAGLVRWRVRHLRHRNTELATLVEARTGELRAREVELVRARDDAESANRAKSTFLANMSHELRTPLNAILGYSQIMAKGAGLPPRAREQVGVIRHSGEHLLGLINEVLDLSKIEAGKLTLAPSDFSLDQLFADAAAAFRPRLAEKGLEYRQTRAGGLPVVVHADVNRLRQVLFNLLSNAVKFTRAGRVWLEVRPAEGCRVRFEVGDTGVGVAADQLQAIFAAFHQTGESALAIQGTGLGLAISQRLVGQMGGEIQVESTPGRGSRFWFELPLAVGDATALTAAGTQDAARHRPVTGYEGQPRRLLVVDDQPENRRVLCDLLAPLGFEIEESVDGEDCLAACARTWPDAVLLDLRFGNRTDGFEVARTLRTRAAGRPLGIVAVSASVFEDARQQALESGCDDFLPKPFGEDQLLAVLARVVGLRWTHAEGPPPPGEDAEPPDAAPPADEVEALLELSLQGDVVGLRERLDTLHAPGAPAGSATLVRTLEPLVANYQMDQLHEKLLRFQHDRP